MWTTFVLVLNLFHILIFRSNAVYDTILNRRFYYLKKKRNRSRKSVAFSSSLPPAYKVKDSSNSYHSCVAIDSGRKINLIKYNFKLIV